MIRASTLDLQRAYESARSLVSGSSEYLKLASAPVTGPPFTIAGWGRSTSATTNQYIMSISDVSATNHQFLFGFRGTVDGDPIEFGARAGGAVAWATTTSGYSVNTWHHVCAVEIASNSRAVYIDGGSMGTDATERAPAGIDVIDIGRLGDSTPDGYFDGAVAWISVWNVALTDAEVVALGNRSNPTPPWEIRPESIVSMLNMRSLWDPYMKARWTPTGTKLANPPWLWRPRQVSMYVPAPSGTIARHLIQAYRRTG